MQKTDYRDLTGTEVLPNYDDKYYLLYLFKEMIQASSQISRGNNTEKRKRTIRESATQIRLYLHGMIQKDLNTKKRHELAKKTQEALEALQNSANGESEKNLLIISEFFYEKGLTALDARNEEDPETALLK